MLGSACAALPCFTLSTGFGVHLLPLSGALEAGRHRSAQLPAGREFVCAAALQRNTNMEENGSFGNPPLQKHMGLGCDVRLVHAQLICRVAETQTVSSHRSSLGVGRPVTCLSPYLRFLLCLMATLVLPAIAAAQIDSMRVVGDGQVTRVTMWSAGPIEADVMLAEDQATQQVLVALEGAGMALDGPAQPVSPATGVAGYGWQDGFLAITLARPMMVSRRLDLPPAGDETRHRLVIDLVAVSDVRFARAARRAEDRVAARLAIHRTAPATLADQNEVAPEGRDVVLEMPPEHRQYVIVIDPGHGGKDPGAIAASGLREKDVVLSASLALRDMLEKTGRYDVRMTRSNDRFIELSDRVSRAREWHADLFISIHADAARKPDVAGASVYTISERGRRRVDGEAEKNNWDIEIEEGVSDEVSGILEVLTIRETQTNSGLFAELLLPELADAGPVLRNTHRKAGFYVLLAPDVPAVLLEMGFLTNPGDASRLADRQGREASMRAVARAIDGYFDQQDVIFASN